MSAPRGRWRKLDEILARALEMAPPARAAFLNEACGCDEALRREVEALLARELEDSSKFVGRAGGEMPRRIAHFEVAGKLGEGGMGAVYRAKDLVLGREVAIKVLPAAVAGDPDRIARFTREAKALAALKPDGKRVLIQAAESSGRPEAPQAVFVFGFFEELRRRAPGRWR